MGFDQSTRETWPDVAKGIGIILVVIGHVWRGLAEAGIPMDETLFRAVDRGIYLFHMPLFFFVSGWFYPKVMRRGTVSEQMGRSALRLLYPLVVWTYLFILVKFVAGGSANDPVSASDLLRWPLPPYLHLWFLWALFVLQVGGLALRLAPEKRFSMFWLALACVTFLLVNSSLELGWMVQQAIHGAPYFFLAAAMSGWKHRLFSAWSGWAALGVIAVVQILIAPHINWGGPTWNSAAVICVLSVVVLAHWPVLSRQGWLAYLGQASMTIYLTHTIFAAAVRIGLLKVGVTNVEAHLVLGVVLGLCLPLVLHSERVPLGLRRVLGFVPWPQMLISIQRA
jgi:fucose 4-O-acetylase-like acetyltransferase